MEIMAEYIERSDVAVFFENSKQTMWHKDDVAATISSKKNIPAADVVSQAVFDQVKWERDTALATLKEHGIGLAEKADVVEVVHSKWIKRNNERRCPVCGFFYLTNGMTVYNFCPMCGAKMDGDKNE
jgi:rubrerythrin